MYVPYDIITSSEIEVFKEATKKLTNTQREVCQKIREQHRNILAAKKTKNKKQLSEQDLEVIV